MAGEKNIQILLAARPQGAPKDSDFKRVEAPVPEPGADEMLLRVLYLSLDPVIRLRMNASSYWPAFELGQPLGARAVCAVAKSNIAAFREGDLVVTAGIWANYMISNGKGLDGRPLPKLDPARGPLTLPLHVLGITGFTAYCGLLEIGQPKPGETVLVSGASGAVGSVAGQIAKLKACRVVGIAGGPRKCAYLVGELGFDAAVDYKRADFADGLKAALPQGIDVYFENVGGAAFDAALPLFNRNARIAVCGTVSDYNTVESAVGPEKLSGLLLAILGKRLTLRGFVIGDWFAKMPQFLAAAGQWVLDGKIKYREEIVEGLERAPAAFQAMLKAETFGKVIVKLGEPPC